MYTKVFLRLEPLGLELVAETVRRSGHEVRLIDLQVATHKDYAELLDKWRPDIVAFSCNYLANVPEIIDLAKLTALLLPKAFVFVGGHSASFIANEFLEHAGDAIGCAPFGSAQGRRGRFSARNEATAAGGTPKNARKGFGAGDQVGARRSRRPF